MKYLVTIYFFGLYGKKSRKTYNKHYVEVDKILHKYIDKRNSFLEDRCSWEEKLVKLLTAKRSDLNRIFPPRKIQNEVIHSQPIVYLLYFLTSYGSSKILLKDFTKIAQNASINEGGYLKEQLITQTSRELYQDDLLLTMLLESLDPNNSPQILVKKYNEHLNFYHRFLEIDSKNFGEKASGVSKNIRNNYSNSLLNHEVALFPSESFYEDFSFPIKITDSKSNEDLTTVLHLIFKLFNLSVNEEQLREDILYNNSKHDEFAYQYLDNIISKEIYSKEIYSKHTFSYTQIKKQSFYEIEDHRKKVFQAIQDINALHPESHFVFNPKIIKILSNLNINNHPFILLKDWN